MTDPLTPTRRFVADIRADFVRRELKRGASAAEAAERWASYAAGPGFTYLQRIIEVNQ